MLSSPNNLLCFLIWNCVLHVFLSATIPRFPVLPSAAPNHLHHAITPKVCFHTMTCSAASNTPFCVIILNISSYHHKQLSFFPFLVHTLPPPPPTPPSLSVSLWLSIPAGYNPCCLYSDDRSLLSANHSSYLTPVMLQYLLSHRFPPLIKHIQSISKYSLFSSCFSYLPSSLLTEDLRSVFMALLHLFV